MSNYRISSRAIIVRDDCILLNEFENGKYYNTPGGGVEIDESLHDAVIREVLEETGYQINVKDMMFIYEYNPKDAEYKYKDRGSLSSFFYCEIDSSKEKLEPSVLDNSEKEGIFHTGSKWIPLNELTQIKLVPSIQREILEALKTKTLKYIKEQK